MRGAIIVFLLLALLITGLVLNSSDHKSVNTRRPAQTRRDLGPGEIAIEPSMTQTIPFIHEGEDRSAFVPSSIRGDNHG